MKIFTGSQRILLTIVIFMTAAARAEHFKDTQEPLKKHAEELILVDIATSKKKAA